MSRRADLGGDPVVPDLELEPVVVKRPVASTRHGGSANPKPADDFGDDDGFELIQTGPTVELSGHAQPGAVHRAPAAAWPTGRCRPADQLAIDPMEVALVADYGSAPNSALLAPLYAYRVYSRRRLLQRAVAEHVATLQREEAERDALLAALANQLRPSLEANETFRRLLEPIRDIERLAGERSAALSQADSGYRERMAVFDRELARLADAASQAHALVTEKSRAAEGTANDFRRADAKHKRVQIEIRGVMDVARQALGPAGGNLPAPQAAQLGELQARLQALEPDLERARAGSAVASGALEQAEAELGRIEAQVHELQRQKAAASGALEQQLSARAAGVSDAEQQMRDALAEVARATLLARGGVTIPDATLQALLAHDARVEAQAVRLETHVRALDSQDHERVRQGVMLALGAVGLVVLAITLKAVL